MELDRKERWERIERSSCNKYYGFIKGSGIPEYLKKEWGKIGGKGRCNLDWRTEQEGTGIGKRKRKNVGYVEGKRIWVCELRLEEG